MAAVNPYLNFSGNCEEAFDFYASVFGGETPSKMRYKDAPPSANPMSENAAEGEKIMHVGLSIGHGSLLMGSDRPRAMGPTNNGNNFYVSIQGESEEETNRLFNGLSAGGHVTMALEKTFWGAYFGMWIDKFGIQWLINYEFSHEQ